MFYVTINILEERNLKLKELKIDPELKDLLPPLTDEEYKQLEKNITENGFDKNFPIMEWHGFIVDGHNRYDICKKHNITDYVVGTLAYETKEEVMEWMLDIQLGRRNLSPIQRIAITEKYRPIYEKQAKDNLKLASGGDRRSDEFKKNQGVVNLPQVDKERNPTTSEKLASVAGVSEKTYRMGAKILNSDNEEVKNAVMSGEMSINAGYNKIKETTKQKENKNNETTTTQLQTTQKELSQPKISEEVKQICEDLKTERSKEYLDSIWNYKIDIIECMNAGFNRFYDGFVSTLEDMENRVTKRELDECIANAENMVEKMLDAIEIAKNIILKTED